MSKPVRFITATCACGATFEREVKRGRPQKWCPACAEVPFYERAQAPVPEVAVDGEIIAEAAAKPQWDDHGDVREQIEEAVAQVNADHKARFATLIAEGVDKYVAADLLDAELREGLQAVYARLVPSKYAA